MIIYSAFIGACEKGKFPEALEHEGMQRPGMWPNAITYNAAIGICCEGISQHPSVSVRGQLPEAHGVSPYAVVGHEARCDHV